MKKQSRTCAAAIFAFVLSLAVAGTAPLFGQDLERVGPTPFSTATEAGAKQTPPTAPNTATAAEAGAPSDYVIGPEDVLDIKVFDVPDLDQTVRVANDGTIALPLLGRVVASGLTADQLRDRLEGALGKNLLQNPHVSVFIRQFQARPVSIMGAVEKPGLYQITGPRTLIEMLSVAGGLAKRSTASAGKTVYVTRPGGFKNLNIVPGMEEVAPDKIAIDLKDLLYAHAEGLNIPVEPH
ncbi:MAG TPA: polysaccharide biosynthesis/export family protein, partial [Terriglobia bacterium]|nr:polysaccharide biosynthesis/export family protein [Terriglobia bacterium]